MRRVLLAVALILAGCERPQFAPGDMVTTRLGSRMGQVVGVHCLPMDACRYSVRLLSPEMPMREFRGVEIAVLYREPQ